MSLRNSIIDAARTEWNHWGKSFWDLESKDISIAHKDDEVQFAKYVVENYCAVGGGNPSIEDICDDRYYWSAVGMSFIMKQSGLNKQQFPFAQAHSVWIRKFVEARKKSDAAAIYWAFRPGEVGAELQVGDLIAYSRVPGTNIAKAAKLFDRTSSYPSHTDVVVAAQAGSVDVIGCNVRDSVTLKRLPVNAAGHIMDTSHAWFAVLKLRVA